MYDTPPKNLLLRTEHGLGDSLMLQPVIRNLRLLYPECEITVECDYGHECFFIDLADHVRPLSWAYNPRGFERAEYLRFQRPEIPTFDLPNTKATRCLQEVFGIYNPDPSLYYYTMTVGQEATERAQKWLDKTIGDKPYWIIHDRGTSQPLLKNLDVRVVGDLCQALKRKGIVPIILDWSKCHPLVKDRTALCPSELFSERHAKVNHDAEIVSVLLDYAEWSVLIDSGPAHILGCRKETVTECNGRKIVLNASYRSGFVVWLKTHPANCYDPIPGPIHLLLPDTDKHAFVLDGTVLDYFREHYRHCYLDTDDLSHWFSKYVRDHH